MNNQPKDLQTELMEWVKKEGFPFEMRVARAFQRAGFWIKQSDYYKDPTTNVNREVDVSALLSFYIKPIVIRVEFLIECKSSKDKPWIVFCGEPEKLETPAAWVVHRFASRGGAQILRDYAHRKEFQNLAFFRLRAPVGYGLRQAFAGKGEDVAYSAMSSVSSAARASADLFRDHPEPLKLLEFQFPVIAIEGRLFECHLSENEEVEMKEIKFATLLWNNPIATSVHTLIDVRTEESINLFAAECYQATHRLVELLSQKEIRKRLLRKRR
jgi:hypothetical protein